LPEAEKLLQVRRDVEIKASELCATKEDLETARKKSTMACTYICFSHAK
jgi:hypothetical protein